MEILQAGAATLEAEVGLKRWRPLQDINRPSLSDGVSALESVM
jgi:hypothetical protein